MNPFRRLAQVIGNRLQLAAAAQGANAPDLEEELRQYTGSHEFPPYVTKILGEFQPHAVTMQKRVMMRNSPDVAFASALARGPIVNMRWTIESKDAKIAAGMEALLRPEYIPLAKSASLAMLYGFQVIQPIYESGPLSFEVEDLKLGKSQTVTLPVAWKIARHKGIDPRTLTLNANEKTDQFESVTQAVEPSREVTVSAENLILWSFRNEDDWGRLTGLGMFDQMYTPWYDQSGLIFLRNTYFEGRAHPVPVGYATSGGMTDAKTKEPVDAWEAMRKALSALKSRSFVVVSGKRDDKGNLLNKIEYLTDDKRGDMFQQAIDAEGVRILKCALVPGESATSEPQGSRARAEVHENRLGEIQQGHVDEWRQVFQAYAKRVAILTFGERAVEESGLTVKASGLSPGLRDLYREVLGKVLDAEATLDNGGSVPLRKRIDALAMADDLELPLRPLEDAQEEWDADKAEGDAKAAAIANGDAGGVKITPDMEKQVQDELARIGAIDDVQAPSPPPSKLHLGPEDLGEIVTKVSASVRQELAQLQAQETAGKNDDQVPAPVDPEKIIAATAKAVADAIRALPQQAAPIINQGDTIVQPAPAPEVKLGDTHVHAGDTHVDAHLELKPGDRKIVLKTGDGKTIEGTSKSEGGGA